MQVAITPHANVPAIGMGTWNIGDAPAKRADEIAALRVGLDAGITLIDTAEMYGSGRSESLVGEAIKGRRDDAYLVSKVLPHNASRKGTVAAAEASLRRLGTDHLDLYLLHWRGSHPFAETIAAFEQLLAAGKILAWGVSNLDAAEMAELTALPGGAKCATDQVLYHLGERGPEVDLFGALAARDISVMAYSPLGQGAVFKGAARRRLAELADDLGVSAATLALAWAIRDGRTVAIPKTAHPERMRENIAALDLHLAADVLAALDEAFPAPDHPVPLAML